MNPRGSSFSWQHSLVLGEQVPKCAGNKLRHGTILLLLPGWLRGAGLPLRAEVGV